VSRWSSDERWPAAAAISGGEILVAWQGPREGSSSPEIHAQRFAPLPDPATVRGVAWADTNRNGVRETGELPLEGVRVGAYTWAGVQVSDTVTAADGSYVLGNIRGDTPHFLTFRGPPGAAFTTPNAGNDDTIDSDVLNDPLNDGRTELFTAPAGGEVRAQDAGILLPVELEGIVWNDVDADGVREPGETGRDGVRVILFRHSGVGGTLGSVVTSNGGRYHFGPLAPGIYSMSLQQLSRLAVTAANQGSDDTIDNDFSDPFGGTGDFTPVPGQTTVLDAGVGPPTAINGVLFRDDNGDGQLNNFDQGLIGWTVFSDYNGNGAPDAGEAVTTSVNGSTRGSFSLRVPPGTHTLTAVPPAGTEPGEVRPRSGVVVALGAAVPLNLPFAPWVTGVFVSGSTWSQMFPLATGPGYLIAESARFGDKLLRWGGIDRITVRFAEPQTLDVTDLEVRGRNGRTYAPVNYTYDDATRTGTWTLDSAIAYDAVALRLRRPATGAVEALGGSVGVLVGDVTFDSRVDRRDLWPVRYRVGTSLANRGNSAFRYEVNYDLNGDARINVLDIALQLRNYGRSAPVPDSGGGAANRSGSLPALASIASPPPNPRRRGLWDEFTA
jgi:hypothetical protein